MPVKLYRKLEPIGRPLALAIGNFDGVHRGHQALLRATGLAARMFRLTPAAMSFHPLPREFFAPADAPPRLMSTPEKMAAIHRQGIQHIFLPRFDRAFADQSAAAFIDTLKAMQVQYLVVGGDFHFGARRSGNIETLRAATTPDFQVECIHEVADEVGQPGVARVSSTAIRAALADGDLPHAAAMLGGHYRIVGRVLHGRKLGRTLGFPTANVALSRRKPPLSGVFAVRCNLVTRGLEGVAGGVQSGNGSTLFGVANLGTNPVVSSENRPHLEVFLFDFDGDLYGQRIAVEFIEKIRDERNFAGLDALTVQMHDDANRARAILARMKNGHQDD